MPMRRYGASAPKRLVAAIQMKDKSHPQICADFHRFLQRPEGMVNVLPGDFVAGHHLKIGENPRNLRMNTLCNFPLVARRTH
jgi:hypothetical protein